MPILLELRHRQYETYLMHKELCQQKSIIKRLIYCEQVKSWRLRVIGLQPKEFLTLMAGLIAFIVRLLVSVKATSLLSVLNWKRQVTLIGFLN